MTTLSTTPTRVVPGKDGKLRFTLTDPLANFVRVWAITAPEGSRWREEIDESDASRVQIYEGNGGDVELPHQFKVGGTYELEAVEYTLGEAAHGGSYEGDPNSFQTETELITTPLTLHIGDRMTFPMGYGPDVVDLVVFVFDDTIRSTDEGNHGEITPRADIGDTTTARALAASESVVGEIAALADVATSAAIGDLTAVSNDILTSYNAHLLQASVHSSNDSDNGVSIAHTDPGTTAGLISALGALRDKIGLHLNNAKFDIEDPLQGVTGSQAYHEPSGSNRADTTNAIRAQPAADTATVMILMSDIWRSYEAHRISAVHDSPDGVNSLAALPALLDILQKYNDVLALPVPPTPATGQDGVIELSNSFGFKKAPAQ